MLLPWISDLGLVASNPEKNILKGFPLLVKRTVVSSIVRYFHAQYEHAISQLTTASHVNWAMEVIGQSFQLPIDDHEVINMAIDIYQRWLFNDNDRPEPIKNDLQRFIQEIFDHFSFIFEARQSTQTSAPSPYNPLKDHIFLANRVLDIFLQMGLHGEMIGEDTWNHILKIILGVTDSTIRGKQGLTELNYGLLKVLFELWLCSLSDDKVMWCHLQTYAVQWGRHMATIKQWNSVCIALTQRVINLLYGPTEGTPIVKIQWKGLNQNNNPNPNVGNPTTELDLPDEYIYYAWNMFLYVVGNPNRLLDPEIHLKAFQGIQFITKLLAYVGTDPPLAKLKQSSTDVHLPYAPDGNTILQVFGPWFFEAVNHREPQFNEGRAVAYAALCRIYCRKGGRPFERENLALFYHAIRDGLAEDDIIVFSAIILNSCKIFSYELEGSHTLIPHYMRVCGMILSGTDKSKYPEVLRSACITLISSLICLPNHFAGAEESEKNPIYVNLKVDISDTFLKSLQEERSTRNIQHVMWCISTLIHEEIYLNPFVAITFIRAMLDLLKNHGAKPMREYQPEVFITIYEVLNTLTPLYSSLQVADPNVALSIVDTIALQVPIQLQLLSNSATQTSYKLIEEGLYCICDWVMVGHDRIMPDRDVVSRIISAIEVSLNAPRVLRGTSPTTSVPQDHV
ncbi:RapGAP, partial [Acrasis kona]